MAAVYLDVESTLLSGAMQKKEAVSQTLQTPPPSVESNVSAGERHFNRLQLNPSFSLQKSTSTAPSTTSSTSPTSPEETSATSGDQTLVQQSSMDAIFEFMSQSAVNLGNTLGSIAQITTLTSEQGNAAVQLAKQSNDDLNAQLAEQEKRQKHMKMLSWGIKILAITILVVSIATGQPELAPLSTLLMTSLTALLIAKPELITNQFVDPLAKGLQSIGVPEKYATLLASVLVITATVAATAGVGFAADSAGLGRMVTEEFGGTTARKMLQETTFSYGKFGAGNALMSTSALIGVTQPITKLLTEMFPNNPLIAQIVATSLTLLLVAGTGIGGTALMGSSGYFARGSKNIETAAMMVTDGLRLTEGVAEGGSGYMTFQQGNTILDLAEAQSSLNIAQSCADTSTNLSQSARSMMSLITNTMADLSRAIESLTSPGAANLRYTR